MIFVLFGAAVCVWIVQFLNNFSWNSSSDIWAIGSLSRCCEENSEKLKKRNSEKLLEIHSENWQFLLLFSYKVIFNKYRLDLLDYWQNLQKW